MLGGRITHCLYRIPARSAVIAQATAFFDDTSHFHAGWGATALDFDRQQLALAVDDKINFFALGSAPVGDFRPRRFGCLARLASP